MEEGKEDEHGDNKSDRVGQEAQVEKRVLPAPPAWDKYVNNFGNDEEDVIKYG